MLLRLLTLLLLLHLVSGVDKEGLLPRQFTATPLNSSAIRLTWKKPSRPKNLSEQYELAVANRTHEESFRSRATEEIITDLEPSTTYNLTVQAVWQNGTPVDAVASASATTWPPGLTPREFRARALSSSSIRVSWKAPHRWKELSGQYELTVYNRTHEANLYMRDTADTIRGLEPSTTYDLMVQASWKNGTWIGAVTLTSVKTMPPGFEPPKDLVPTPATGPKKDKIYDFVKGLLFVRFRIKNVTSDAIQKSYPSAACFSLLVLLLMGPR
ncbi:hypothetical protein SprV_0602231400 [Sparganum proliferum]